MAGIKLSKRTMGILNNFAKINPNVMIEKGKKMKTISEAKSFQSIAEIDEELPVDFGVWDLPEFLSALSFFKEPELNFIVDGEGEDESITLNITDGNTFVNYYPCDARYLSVPKKKVPAMETKIKIKLSNTEINNLIKASGSLSLDDLVFEPIDEKTCKVFVSNVREQKTNRTEPVYAITVPAEYKDFAESTGKQTIIDVAELKMYPADYCFEVKESCVEMTTEDGKIKYWIAIQVK